MPISPDIDPQTDLTGIPAPASLLSSDEQLVAGVRVNRAQFARMMGCSRQCVTDWVRAGRLTVGPDGRFDPRQAVASLLRTGDPARLRARVLQPLALELQTYRARIVELEAALGQALRTVETQRGQLLEQSENAAFFEQSADGFADVFSMLETELSASWHALVALPDGDGLGIVLEWLDRALLCGSDPGPMLPREVVEGEEGGECPMASP